MTGVHRMIGQETHLRSWINQVMAFTIRYLREMFRSKIGVFWSFVFPAVWYGLTVHLGVAPTIEQVHYPTLKAVMGISFGIFGAFTVSLVGFTGDFASDIDVKRYRKFRSLPLYSSADLTGRFAAGGILGLTSWFVTVVIAAIDGASFQLVSVVSIIVVPLGVILFCLIGMVTGLVTTLIIPKPQYATTLGTGILIVGFFVTGYNGTVAAVFPADTQLLNYIPNSLATRLVTNYLVDTSWEQAGLVPPTMPDTFGYVLLLAVYATCFTVIGVIAMNKYVYTGEIGE